MPSGDRMTTLIIMLALLTGPWLVGRLIAAARRRDFNLGAIGAGLLFAFTGIGHFIITRPMAQMLPGWVPARTELVYLTGILELVIAAGFFVPRFRRLSGWAAVLLLVLFFPVNVYAALNRVPLGGHAWGPLYLLVRTPVQAIIVGWIYWFTIRPPTESGQAPARKSPVSILPDQ
jgi:uncharacterized membrane protein